MNAKSNGDDSRRAVTDYARLPKLSSEFVEWIRRLAATDEEPCEAVERLLGSSSPTCCLSIRRRGKFVADTWMTASTPAASLRDAFRTFRTSTIRSNDTAIVCLLGRSRPVESPEDWKRIRSNVHRGRFAYRISLEADHSRQVLVSPTEIIATNRSLDRVITKFLDEHEIDASLDELPSLVQVQEYEATQYLIGLIAQSRACRLYRGNQVTDASAISLEVVHDLQQLLGDYLFRSVAALQQLAVPKLMALAVFASCSPQKPAARSFKLESCKIHVATHDLRIAVMAIRTRRRS